MNEKLTIHTRRGQATSLRAYIVDQNNQPIASGGVKYRIQEQFYPFEAKREESVSDVFSAPQFDPAVWHPGIQGPEGFNFVLPDMIFPTVGRYLVTVVDENGFIPADITVNTVRMVDVANASVVVQVVGAVDGDEVELKFNYGRSSLREITVRGVVGDGTFSFVDNFGLATFMSGTITNFTFGGGTVGIPDGIQAIGRLIAEPSGEFVQLFGVSVNG